MGLPHTPDDDTVKFAFVGHPNAIWPKSERGKVFDRWLNEVKAQAWDRGHGAPCDEWWDSDMCREYHPNPYRKEN